jgi:hypothetical protein
LFEAVAVAVHLQDVDTVSCHRFRGNEVRLWLNILAYNLGNLWRLLGLPDGIDDWSLTSLQQRLIKTGGRLNAPDVASAVTNRIEARRFSTAEGNLVLQNT